MKDARLRVDQLKTESANKAINQSKVEEPETEELLI